MLRKSILKGSWYPDRAAEITSELERWSSDITADPGLLSAIVPHAGWYYSGKTAAEALKRVCPRKKVLAVIGGHLPPGSSIIAAPEDQIETPLGPLNNRLDLIRRLAGELAVGDDIFSDNTVEVILPMVKAFSPEAEIMWLRSPADEKSITLGEKLFELAESEHIELSVVGSTDLTHYGSNYGFHPEGPGADGLDWVKKVNDAEIISLLTNYRLEDAIKHANKNRSACSIGAAAAAARFAELAGAAGGRLVDYTTSYDIRPAESFVGYAGIVF